MPEAATADCRIHILGLPSAGKSTFAEALSAGLGLRHHDLDPLAFRDSDWTPRADAERLEGARRIAGEPAWITEGNHLGWVDPLLAAADIVVWLDPPLRTLLLRHLRRHMRRGPRWLVARWRFLVRSYLGRPTATREPGDAALVTRAAIAVALAPWEHKVLRCSRPPTTEKVPARSSGKA